MLTIFTLLACVLLVAVLLFFIGSLLKGKAQSTVIRGSIVLFALCVLFSRNWFGPSQAAREYYSGHYKIETADIKYPNKVIQQNRNLTLTVKKDLTFELNRASPFFQATTGTWTFESIADYEVIKFKLDNEDLEDEMLPSIDKWSLRSQDSTQQYISFKRLR